MKNISLGPWPAGMDNVSPEPRDGSARRPRTVFDARDVDFDRDGNVMRRPGAVQLDARSIHSIGSAAGHSFCMVGNQLCRIAWPWSAEVIATLPTADPVSYTSFDGAAIVSSRSALVRVDGDGSVRDVAPPNAPTFTVAPIANGGLDAGRYGVAVSTIAAHGEGPLGPILFVDVPAGGGLQVSGLSVPAGGTSLQLYRTGANGDVLYAAAVVPTGMPQFLLGSGARGRDCIVRNTGQMPPGSIVRPWRGRLVTAQGRYLRFSLPMRPGLTDIRHGWKDMTDRIVMVEPVEGGLWVGTTRAVFWLPGSTPEEMRIVRTTAAPPVPGASMVTQSESLPDALELGALPVALWLSADGYCIGGPDGRLIQPQAKQITLQPGVFGSVTYVQSTRRFAALSR